jgi:MFS family permease
MVATVLVGLSIGAEIDLLAYLASRYFGLQRFGLNYGILFAAFLAGTALGPVAYGAVFDAFGTYRPVLAAAALCVLGCGLAMFALPRYGHAHA